MENDEVLFAELLLDGEAAAGEDPAADDPNILGSRPARTLGSKPAIAAAWAAAAEDDEALVVAGLALVGVVAAPESNFGSMPAACRSLGSILASTLGSSPPNPIMALGSKPSILGSIEAKDLGSKPANLSMLGSMPAKSLGSKPKAAAAELKEVDGVEVLGADEVLGDLRSSLLALALDGGLGEALGELDPLAVVGVLVELVLALEPRNMSIPGMPDNMAGFMP